MCCLLAFVCATLANVADVTQVAQLGRYYLPVFVPVLPPAAAATLLEWARQITTLRLRGSRAARSWRYCGPTRRGPTTSRGSAALSASLPALRAAGDWIRQHPGRCRARRASHDLVPLGIAALEPAHDHPDAAQFRCCDGIAQTIGSGPLRLSGDARPVGIVRAAAAHRPRGSSLRSGSCACTTGLTRRHRVPITPVPAVSRSPLRHRDVSDDGPTP